MPGIPIKLRRGDRGVRQPVERNVVEDVVPRQPLPLAVDSARDHSVAANVMVEHPRCKADRRIDNPVQCLRAVVHLERVAQPVLVEVVKLIPRVFFIRREASRRRATERECLRHIGGNGGGHVGVNTEQSRRLLQGHDL